MPREYLDYIDRKFEEKKGIEELPDGKKYKNSTLEKYYQKGYLDGSKYDSLDLYKAGMKIFNAYTKKGGNGVKAIDPSKIRVDGGGGMADSEFIDLWQGRYERALRVLPREFKDIVVDVCCEDVDILRNIKTKSERQATQQRQVLMALLRFGLVRLVEYYR